ncbi:Tubulin-specific chaperone D [Portunus trituberculatus]|uniref:Tubulin-specific chaperone D n=1 Tax=Portunus trituberculatus TaxID=210409 RepID=A0A5B7GEG5_PORTR|nr:Tubulin-specific chaperone D [Portunus trituberculatus]
MWSTASLSGHVARCSHIATKWCHIQNPAGIISIPHISGVAATESLFLIDWHTIRDSILLTRPIRSGPLVGYTRRHGEDISRYTNEAVHKYLSARAEKVVLLAAFLETLMEQLATHQKVERITLPLLKTIGDLLSSSAVLDSVLEQDDTYISRLLALMKKECQRCSDYHKLAAVITVLCELLRLSSPTTKATLTQLALFLGYQMPAITCPAMTSWDI